MNDQINQESVDQDPSVDPTTLPDSEMVMPESEEPTEAHHSSLGIILGVLVVILVLILGGLYLWGTTMKTYDEPMELPPVPERPTAEKNNEPESTNAEAEVEVLETVSTSDEIEAIEADLEATDLDALDAELDIIEAELDASLQAI